MLIKDRLAKSKTRILNNSELAKSSGKARKLFTGSAFSMPSWGHQAAALSEQQIKDLEQSALACSGLNPAGRCRTFGLVAAYGVLGTPRAKVIRETIRSWFEIPRTCSDSEISDIRAAWPLARNFMLRNNCRITGVTGIMSNKL